MADTQQTKAKARKIPKGRHISAFKRQRQNLKRAARNASALSPLKTFMKKIRASGKDRKSAEALLRQTVSLLHKAGRRGLIHPRAASRNIARLSSFVHRLSTA